MAKHKKSLLWILVIAVIAGLSMLVVSTRTSNSTNANTKQNNNPHASTTARKLLTVAPANKNSSLLTQKTLAYFYEHANDHSGVIIGQYIGGVSEGAKQVNNEYQTYYKQLEEKTGKLPALIGVDYGWEHQPDNYTYINSLLIDHARKGGLVEISMSPGNPFTGGGLRDLSLGGHKYDEIVTAGTDANKRWIETLDRTSVGLAELEAAGVTVLWRPLHEMNGDFFWWSYGEGGRANKDEYIKLWKYTFDYMVKTKKLNNLLWVYSPNASMWENGVRDTDYYYPGPEYVDIVGMDYYADDMSQLNNHGNYDKLVALNKPFGLAEVGANTRSGFDNMIIMNAIKDSYPQTIYTMHWSGWSNLGILHTKRAIIENKNAKMFMNDPAVVTLDKIKR